MSERQCSLQPQENKEFTNLEVSTSGIPLLVYISKAPEVKKVYTLNQFSKQCEVLPSSDIYISAIDCLDCDVKIVLM